MHTPQRDAVELVSFPVKNAEYLSVPISKFLLYVSGQSIRIGIQELLEFLQLKLFVTHDGPDDLAFFRSAAEHLHPAR
jgi:hypothetical protein